MNLNIFALLGLIGAAQGLVGAVKRLATLLGRASTDTALKTALAGSPHTSAAISDISAKLRAVQDSAGAVIKDKNLHSKEQELERLISHVRALVSAFTTDTHDPAVLEEVSKSSVLQGWLSEISLEWNTIQGALGAFRL